MLSINTTIPSRLFKKAYFVFPRCKRGQASFKAESPQLGSKPATVLKKLTHLVFLFNF